MGVLTVNPEMQVLLGKLKDKTELRDADGKLVGLFTPKDQVEAVMIEEARKIFNLEEAKRRLATEKPGRTTQEVLQRLKSMETSE